MLELGSVRFMFTVILKCCLKHETDSDIGNGMQVLSSNCTSPVQPTRRIYSQDYRALQFHTNRIGLHIKLILSSTSCWHGEMNA